MDGSSDVLDQGGGALVRRGLVPVVPTYVLRLHRHRHLDLLLSASSTGSAPEMRLGQKSKQTHEMKSEERLKLSIRVCGVRVPLFALCV